MVLVFKGRSSWLAKRESFMNIVVSVPSRLKSPIVSLKMEVLEGGEGGRMVLLVRLASCYDRHSWQQMSAMA
jgi:hypothetical protein